MARILRQFLRSPAFCASAILTLALGIGANTAMFSVVNALLLRPLPYPESGQLVTVWESSPERGVEEERVSGPNYLDWRRENRVFADMAATPSWTGANDFNVLLGDRTIRVRGAYTTASLFTTLGSQPLLGRTLLPEEDAHESSAVAVIGYGLWQRVFGGDSNIIGRTLTVDSYGRRDYTVVGVMPRGFGLPGSSELWLPIGWTVSLENRRSAHWHQVIARLRPGVTVDHAQADLNVIQSRLRTAYPGERIGSSVMIVPMIDQALGPRLRSALLILWGVVSAVLLITCANVGNLMLARAATRQRELALRVALGASRWRLVRQLLGESMVLALVGGLVGVGMAAAGLKLFVALSPPDIPRLNEVSLDWAALAYTGGISLIAGVLFGLVPALQFSRPDLNAALQEANRGCSSGTAAGLTRSFLVVGQVAVSLVLLTGAGLMLQSFARMLHADRGFEPEHLVTAELDFSVSGFTTWVEPTATRPQVPLEQLLERLRALPSVESVAAGSRLLRREIQPPQELITIFGRPARDPAQQPRVDFQGVTPGWFRAIGGRLLRGRDLAEADTLLVPRVVLVNETLARLFFPDTDPIGQHIRMGTDHSPLNATDHRGISEWCEIVGVVADLGSLHARPVFVPEVYASYWQWPMQNPTVLVRTRGDSSSMAEMILRETQAVLPMIPSPRIRTMDHLLSQSVAEPRMQVGLLGLFAGLALVLASVGLYGVLSCMVSQRQREIGIRIALGAPRLNVLWLIMGAGMRLVVIGLFIGIFASLAITRVLRNLLYSIDPTDPLTIVLVVVAMIAVAVVACGCPACRATRIHPIETLRAD